MAPKPAVRVTLNLPPGLYLDVQEWCIDAARVLGRPRVSVQDAMRAMIQAGVSDAGPATTELQRNG